MPQTRVVGISGNITRPSRTRAFVDHIVHRLAVDAGASAQTFDIEDFGASLLPARRLDELAPEARYVVGQILAADILVVASPTFKEAIPASSSTSSTCSIPPRSAASPSSSPRPGAGNATR